jgi:membrane fusion protein (multidrug efflux system)
MCNFSLPAARSGSAGVPKPGSVGRMRAAAALSAFILLAPAVVVAQTVGVVVAPVELSDFPFRFEALGTAQSNESVDITSKVSEIAVAVHFHDGQEVETGQVLVQLQNAEANANLAETRAQLSDLMAQYERARSLHEKRVLSESELQQLQAQVEAGRARVLAAEARLADTVIRAPFSGRVGFRRVSVGALVTPGTVITTLDDISTIKLDFSVPETFYGPLRPGLDIRARSVAWPEREFAGVVTTIDTRIDPVARSVAVRAEIPNPEKLLMPGMFMSVDVINEQRMSLVVPEQAIVPEREERFVYVVNGTSTEKRRVVTGRRRPGQVEIIEGLREGELVITEGTQKVRPGVEVTVIGGAAPS